MGSDSIERHDHAGGISVHTACKIAQAGRIFFATAGHLGFTVNDTDRRQLFGERVPVLAKHGGSSLKNFVIDTLINMNRETVLQAAELLMGRLAEPLKEMLTWNMIKKPQYYAENLLNKHVTHLILFAWENDSPILAVADFAAREGKDNRPQVISYLMQGPTIVRGWNSDVGHMINDTFLKGNPASEVEKVIEAQIQAAPEKVTGPIDIIRLDKMGPKWIQRKPECPDVTLPRCESSNFSEDIRMISSGNGNSLVMSFLPWLLLRE